MQTILYRMNKQGSIVKHIEKAEHGRIDAFTLLYRRRLLRVPWTAKRSNQLMLKEISPENSLEAEAQILWQHDEKN